MRPLASVLLASSVVAFAGGDAAAQLRAEQIREATADELLIRGPDAIGGVGDWYLTNDRIEVIVDDPGREYAALGHGGTLVDVGLRDRTGEDQFARLWPLLNLDQRVTVDFDAITAEVDPEGGYARLVVSNRGGEAGIGVVSRGSAIARLLDPLVPDGDALREVFVETEYRVVPGESTVSITTTISNEGDTPAPLFAYGDVWMRGGRSARAFVGNALEPGRSPGLHHKSFDRTSILAASDAFAAFTHVSVPGMRQFPPVAYALFAPERAARGLLQFGVTGEHVNFMNAFIGDPTWDRITLPRLLGATGEKLAAGASWTYRRLLLVTGEPSIASTTDAIFPALGVSDGSSGVFGRIEPANEPVGILVSRADGAPFTHIAPPSEGADAGGFRAVLPPGEYRLSVRAKHRSPKDVPVSVSAGAFTDAGSVTLSELGWLEFDPAFSDGGGGRVIVLDLGRHKRPVFGDELLDFRIDGHRGKSGTERSDLDFVGNDSDPQRVAVAPGNYRLVATRGLEFDVSSRNVRVTAGGTVRVEPFVVRRAVRTPGFVRADFHVHAQASDDSGMSHEQRLRSFVAEDVDVIVASDHDNISSYDHALASLGLADRIRVVSGVEMTGSSPNPVAPWTVGHHNAWPLAFRRNVHRHGAPPSQNRSVADLYAGARRAGAAVVQLNHPRSDQGGPDDGAYFTHLGTEGRPFDPGIPLDESPNDALLVTASDGRTRVLDFDAIEVINGEPYGRHPFPLMRDDWYALLRQGQRKTGTANSDTHGPGQLAGYPRNYVGVDGPLTLATLEAAVLAGRSFGTTGPLITDFRVNGASMGEDVAAPGGRVEVSVRVEAAPWVPVEELRILANGEIIQVFQLVLGGVAGSPVRFDQSIPLSLSADAFITIEAGAPLGVDPEHWAAARGGLYSQVVAPDFVTVAFANPIYVDVDGNGRFDPPGVVASASSSGWTAFAAVLAGLAAVGGWRLRRRYSGPAQRSGLGRRNDA